MDNLTPAQMQQLLMMRYQGGAPGGRPGAFGGAFGATAPSANVGTSYGSPVTIDHMGEDAGMPSQLQGYSLFNPADWNTQQNRFMPGTSYGYYGPDGSFMRMDKTQTDGPDGIQSLVLAGILAAAGGAAYGAYGGGGAAAADGAGGMSLAEGAYPASITGAEAGAGSTAAMGAGAAADGAGGMGLAEGAYPASIAGGTEAGVGGVGGAGAGTYTMGNIADVPALTGSQSMAGIPSLGTSVGSTSALGTIGSALGGSGGYGGLVGAGANIVGGLIGAGAAKSAANTQAAAADRANQLNKDIFDKQVQLQEPWRQGGGIGLNALEKGLGLSSTGTFTPNAGINSDTSGIDYGSLMKKFGPSDLQLDPSYQFRLQQGQQALERSAAARGGLLSGRAAKDMTNYAQGAASQEYSNAYNRFNSDQANQYNRLASLAGVGQTAANQVAGYAGQYGTNATNNIIGAGNAQAAGQIGAANSLSSGLASGWNAYQSNNLMNQLLNRQYGP